MEARQRNPAMKRRPLLSHLKDFPHLRTGNDQDAHEVSPNKKPRLEVFTTPWPAQIHKKLKTYGRKKHVRVPLQDRTNSLHSTDECAKTKSQHAELSVAPTANSKVKRSTAPGTIEETLPRFHVARYETREVESITQAKEAGMIIAQRQLMDAAIAENDRLDTVFETKRLQLYEDLKQARKGGWITKYIELWDSSKTTRIGVTSKRCKVDPEEVMNEIRKLRGDRERVWWKYYSSIEGLTIKEKEQMRHIKVGQLRNPDYNGPTKRLANNNVLQSGMFGCLYCEKDSCSGC